MRGLAAVAEPSELDELAAAIRGALPPKLKPSPSLRGPGGDCSCTAPLFAEGITLSEYSTSCPPSASASSAIDCCGSEPGRGKNTDRLREWMRACRRVAVGEGGPPFCWGVGGEPAFGKRKEGDSGRVFERAGNAPASGEGEKVGAPDEESVRVCEKCARCGEYGCSSPFPFTLPFGELELETELKLVLKGPADGGGAGRGDSLYGSVGTEFTRVRGGVAVA